MGRRRRRLIKGRFFFSLTYLQGLFNYALVWLCCSSLSWVCLPALSLFFCFNSIMLRCLFFRIRCRALRCTLRRAATPQHKILQSQHFLFTEINNAWYDNLFKVKIYNAILMHYLNSHVKRRFNSWLWLCQKRMRKNVSAKISMQQKKKSPFHVWTGERRKKSTNFCNVCF